MQEYLAHVAKESEFDGYSVLSFLGDFGIGNTLEKDAAIKVANTRGAQMKNLSAQRECVTTVNGKI